MQGDDGLDVPVGQSSESSEERETTRADCDNCKWFMGLGYNCLLGRSRDRCNNNPARRGDGELVDRLLNMSDEDKAKLRTRLELEDGGLRERSQGEPAAKDPAGE